MKTKTTANFILINILVLLYLIVNFNFLGAQTTNETNLAKYWHYRYRLVNYFMVIGSDHGESLPAGIRNWCGPNGCGYLHWGDEPVYLGYYIGVLATEYELLHRNNQPTDQTLTELFYALNAMDRIDINGEVTTIFAGSQPNGYMFEDDVPDDFIINHPQLNSGLVQNVYPPPSGGNVGWASSVKSTYADWNWWRNNDITFNYDPSASQDQLFNLLMGLALVKKYVPNGVLFNNTVYGGTNNSYTYLTGHPSENFHTEAVDEALRITKYMSNYWTPVFGNVFPPWTLVRPSGGANNGPMAISNSNGGDAYFFSTGIVQADNYFNPNQDELTNPISILNEPVWQSYQSDDCWRTHPSNIKLPLVLVTIGNSWRTIENFSIVNTTHSGIGHQGNFQAGNTGNCAWFANDYGWDAFYGTIERLLHDENIDDENKCGIKDMLDSAPGQPGSGGPWYYANDPGPWGWRCSRRFYYGYDDENGDNSFEGNYNGLDYMLLHNLYYLMDEGQAYISNYMPVYKYQNGQNIGITFDHIYAPYHHVDPCRKILVEQTHITELDNNWGDATIVGGDQGIWLQKQC